MADYISNPLLSLIKEQGLIDDLQLDEVLAEQNRSGKSIAQILQDSGIVELETQLQIVAAHLGTEVIDLADKEIPPEILSLIPATTARMYQCVPVADYGSVIQVALSDPLNPAITDELGFVVRKEVQVLVADPNQIAKIIEKHYPENGSSFGDALKELDDDDITRDAQDAAASN